LAQPRHGAGRDTASPNGGHVVGARSLELTPGGDGTLLATTFDYALPGGVFGKIAHALIVKRMNGKSLEEARHNFKALVERQ
jgi:hypothetical protein